MFVLIIHLSNGWKWYILYTLSMDIGQTYLLYYLEKQPKIWRQTICWLTIYSGWHLTCKLKQINCFRQRKGLVQYSQLELCNYNLTLWVLVGLFLFLKFYTFKGLSIPSFVSIGHCERFYNYHTLKTLNAYEAKYQ